MNQPPLPEPDVSVPFCKETRTLYQGDYYRADKVLPLLKHWAVLYAASKAGHEQAYAEAVKAATENTALRERVRALELQVSRVRMYLWDVFPECCGCWVVGAEYMGQQEMVCCGNAEPVMLNDETIIKHLRTEFPDESELATLKDAP